MAIGIPNTDEYNAYYKGYVGLVESDDILTYLKKEGATTFTFYQNIPENLWDYRYAPGKWTIKGVLQHIIDTERIFAYRMLRVSRGDATPLAGFDQNAYADNLDLSHRTGSQLIAEFKAVREATIGLMEGMAEQDWQKMGIASDAPISTRALAYLIAGHDKHHRNVLAEKYLS